MYKPFTIKYNSEHDLQNKKMALPIPHKIKFYKKNKYLFRSSKFI